MGLQFLVDNAQKVVVQGVEANGDFAITHNLIANAGINYVDAKYDRTPADVLLRRGGQQRRRRLRPVRQDPAPDAALALERGGADRREPVPVGELYGRVDWTWQSSMLADTNLDPRSLQPEYSLVNLRLGVKTDHGTDVSVWANNVGNTTYSQADYVSNLFGSNDPAFQRYLGRPREYGVTVRQNF